MIVHRFKHNAVSVVAIIVGSGLLATSLLAGPHRESAPHRCAGCASGQCQVGTPYGFWGTHWRRWPGAISYRGYKQPTPSVSLPEPQVPDALDETRIEKRTRSEEPLEGDDTTAPLLPDDGGLGEMPPPLTEGRDPLETTPGSELPPAMVPDVDFDNGFTPVPPTGTDLFDDLDPAPELPNFDAVPEGGPEALPGSDDLLDFGFNPPNSYLASAASAIRSIKNRRDPFAKQQTPALPLVPVQVVGPELNPAELDSSLGTPFDDNLLPPAAKPQWLPSTRGKAQRKGPAPAAEPAELDPRKTETATANQVLPVVHEEEVLLEDAVDLSPAEPSPENQPASEQLEPVSSNPLRRNSRPSTKDVSSAAIPPKQLLSPPKLKPVNVSASAPMHFGSRNNAKSIQRSLRSTLRKNPLRDH